MSNPLITIVNAPFWCLLSLQESFLFVKRMFLNDIITIIDMPRNLDLTAMRSFVAVADTGGVTRAGGLLNLTQSTVSMQLKRLEESMGLSLLDRSQRNVSLTATGEQFLTYARRMVDLNDEAVTKLTDTAFEGEITFGLPHDLVYPAVPQILRRFADEYPRVKVQLITANTVVLKRGFARGQFDFILTTEEGLDAEGETLIELPLVWIGAPGGSVWRERPLRLAFSPDCIFRGIAQAALDRTGIPWEMAVESASDRTIEATVTADLAVHVLLAGTEPDYSEQIVHNGILPHLVSQRVNMYRAATSNGQPAQDFESLIRHHFEAL